MALQRQMNFLGQQRIDVPHLRMLESGVAADFDALAGRGMAGQRALVLKGFELATSAAVGQPAASLQMVVAGSVLIHPLASESGSVFTVADDAAIETLSVSNAKVEGAFVANTTNYVGIDLRREEDDSTSDLVMFLNALTFTETPRTVPLARTLNFRIVISSVEFSGLPHVCPVAKVVTNSSNNVVSVEDARQMMFRLGRGGSTIDRQYVFPWSGGRVEGTVTADTFQGGDKAIGSLKDWQDAVMTRLWELGGGERWYGMTTDREVKLIFGQPVLGNGDNFLWTLGSSTIQWTSLQLLFANSTATFNTVTNGSTTLADGECLYVDCDRDTEGATLVMQKGVRLTLGAPVIPGSRMVIAWRKGTEVFFKDKQYEAGRLYAPVASTTTTGTVKLRYAAGTPADPVVNPVGTNGAWSNVATAGNTVAVTGTGFGTGAGLRGDGGANGTGVIGVGGASGGAGLAGTGTVGQPGGSFSGGPSAGDGVTALAGAGGAGVRGTGSGSGAGVIGNGGGSNGTGVIGNGGATDGDGVRGIGSGTQPGVRGTGGATGSGVIGQGGSTSGSGGTFTGGPASAGVTATGGTTSGNAVTAQGTGSGHGVSATGGATGDGLRGQGGSTSGPGVRGTGGPASAGVIGVGGTTSGAGATLTGTGSGNGLDVTAGTTGRAVAGVGGTVGAAQFDVTGTVTGTGRPLSSSTNALTLRNTQNLDETVVALQFLHADATSPRDGWVISTQRIADDNTTLTFSSLLSGAGSTALPVLVMDGGLNPPVYPAGDNAIDLGKSATNRWKNIYAVNNRVNAEINVPTDITLSGVNPTLTPGSSSFVRLNSGSSSGNITVAAGIDGQRLTLLFVGGTGTPVLQASAGNTRLSAAITLGASTAFDTVSMIYDATTSAWYETGRSNN